MADDKKKDATEEQPPKKSKKMLWVIIAAVVLGGGGAAGYFAMKGDPTTAATDAAKEPAQQPAGLVPMDTFLVNLNDPDGARFMKLTLRLAISPESAAETVETDELVRARIRDRILTLLTSKTFPELVSPLGKENLRHEIQAQLEPLIESGGVQDVLFSEFVVQ